jgi:hypothetical protein
MLNFSINLLLQNIGISVLNIIINNYINYYYDVFSFFLKLNYYNSDGVVTGLEKSKFFLTLAHHIFF